MVRTVWARSEAGKRLYLVDEGCDFVLSVKQYLDYLAALERSPHTQQNHCRHLCHYFTFLEQSTLQWHQVTPDDLVHFVQWLRNPLRQVGTVPLHGSSRLSERSVNTIMTTVSSFYRYQIQRGAVLSSQVLYEQISNRASRFKPFLIHTSRGKTSRRVIKLKEPDKRVKTVKDEDFETFFNSIENLQFRCIVLLMREGGLRVGEVLGLLIQDLEFHRNGIWIRRREHLENGALAKSLVEGEERFLDLSPALMALLDHLLLQHTFETDHLFVVLKPNARDTWGLSTYGHPLGREALKGLFRHYSRKSGIPLHAHLLRHSHATELIRAGWDASYVQKRLGHAQVQTTINTYVHLDDEDMRQKWRTYQKEQVHGKCTTLRQISLEHLTPAQEKFWTLLQDEQNRTLPVLQLCQRAGYKTTASWYTAVRDEPFRERVVSLGIVVYREHHESSPRGTIPLASDPDAEWAKDIVDLRSLVSEYPKHVSASALKLNFAFLASPALKALVKRYLRARLGFWQPSSLRSYLRWLKPFLWNVEHLYLDLDSFAPLTRAMIEPLLTAPFWIDERGRRHAISVFGKRYMLIAVEGMFSYMQRHAWEEAPRHLLIYEEDRPSEPKKRPRPIPESVLAHLLSHLDLLHPYARNLVAILSVVGLRAIDALHLTEACLEFDATGDPRLHWYNHKLKRDGRPLPVTMEVAEAIQRQQALVREIPDLFGQRYLFRTKRGLYRFQRFCDHLNELAQHLPIVGPDGHIYRFKPHQFRHTVGTQMINNGLGIADVMAYLDHMSPEMTLRYAEINDTTLKQKFKALVRISGKRPGVWLCRSCEGNWSKGMSVSWIGSSPICADSRCPGDIVCTMPRPPNVLTGRMCVLRKTMALATSW